MLRKQRLDFANLKTRLKVWIDWLKCTAKTFFTRRLDFPFENKIETMDRLAKIARPKTFLKLTVRFSIFKKGLKLWIDGLKRTAKKMLKQRSDFLFEKGIETMDRLPKIQGQKFVETTLRNFPFENKIETIDRLAKMHRPKNS